MSHALVRLSRLKVYLGGVRAQTRMEIWCATGMCVLKIASSETNLDVKVIHLLFVPMVVHAGVL